MISPPGSAELLVAALGARTDFREALLGDLAEEFALRVERDGIGAARRWYYRESIRSTPYLLRDWARGLRARDVSHLAGVVLSSCVFLVMIGAFLGAAVLSVVAALGVSPDFRLLPAGRPRLGAMGLTLGIVSAATGGYIAAWLHPRAPLVGALALGVVWACGNVAVMAIAGGSAPAWYRLAAPIVVVIGTTAGGILRICRSRSLDRIGDSAPVGGPGTA